MYTFLTELQSRPDGIINSTIKAYSSVAVGLSQYYKSASTAVTSTSFTGVALTLQDADGNIIKNEHFDTLYVEPEEVVEE